MSGRSAGWGDDVPALDTSTASSSAPLSALTSTAPSLDTAVTAPLTQRLERGHRLPARPPASINTVSLSQAEDAIGARQAWPYGTGRGVDVALIDTGIAPVAGLTGAGQGRQRSRPVLRVAGPRPALRRQQRSRHAHGRHHRRQRRVRESARPAVRRPVRRRGRRPRRATGQRQGRRRQRRHRRLAGAGRASTGSSSTPTTRTALRAA